MLDKLLGKLRRDGLVIYITCKKYQPDLSLFQMMTSLEKSGTVIGMAFGKSILIASLVSSRDNEGTSNWDTGNQGRGTGHCGTGSRGKGTNN